MYRWLDLRNYLEAAEAKKRKEEMQELAQQQGSIGKEGEVTDLRKGRRGGGSEGLLQRKTAAKGAKGPLSSHPGMPPSRSDGEENKDGGEGGKGGRSWFWPFGRRKGGSEGGAPVGRIKVQLPRNRFQRGFRRNLLEVLFWEHYLFEACTDLGEDEKGEVGEGTMDGDGGEVERELGGSKGRSKGLRGDGVDPAAGIDAGRREGDRNPVGSSSVQGRNDVKEDGGRGGGGGGAARSKASKKLK